MTEKKMISGFVSIIGRPNVGKSTFLNHVVGQKIAIMSDKPQTTRNKIQGVYTTEYSQIVFIDTPGIHKPKHKLGDFMMRVAQNTFGEVDAILFMVNVMERFGPGEKFILEKLQNVEAPVILVLNKIDQASESDVLQSIETYKDLYPFEQIVPISALNGENIQTLLTQVESYLEEGPMYYPVDQVTDHPERFIVSELIREKVLHLTREEVPHSIAVVTEKISTENEGRNVHIHATIIVERPSQKGIIIGKQGKMLKEIGTRARHDIEHLLGSKVFLELWVRVEKNWRDKVGYLREIGYKEDEY